jgi:elongation factor G
MPRDVSDPDAYFTEDRFPDLREYHYDPDLNYAFVNRVTGGVVPKDFIPAVEKGVRERMNQGVVAGYQVQDVICELSGGKAHQVDSSEMAFKTAGNMGFKKVFEQAAPVLLEPIVILKVTCPKDTVGDIVGDLNCRGQIEGMDEGPGGSQVIRAKASLASLTTYGRTLAAMTGGQGQFTWDPSHYEMVSPDEQARIVNASRADANHGSSRSKP